MTQKEKYIVKFAKDSRGWKNARVEATHIQLIGSRSGVWKNFDLNGCVTEKVETQKDITMG